MMDEVGSERATIMTSYDAGPMGMLFAATKPERTAALILVNSGAKYLASDDYPMGLPAEAADELNRTMGDRWGSEDHVVLQVPSRADDPGSVPGTRRRPGRSRGPRPRRPTSGRCSPPTPARCCPRSTCPPCVLHRSSYRFMPLEHGQYLADHIEGAKLVELPGADGPLYWDHPGEALDAIEAFVTGVAPAAATDRVLATVLYTDIVDSTRLLARMGDARWQGILDTHDDLAGGDWSTSTVAGSSRARATASWRPSTVRAEGSGSRPASARSCSRSTWRSAPGSTPARSRCAAATSAGWPCTWRRGSCPRRARARFSSRGP